MGKHFGLEIENHCKTLNMLVGKQCFRKFEKNTKNKTPLIVITVIIIYNDANKKKIVQLDGLAQLKAIGYRCSTNIQAHKAGLKQSYF